MKKYTWSESENDELWSHGLFDTVKECIKDAKENYDYKIGETIAVGITEPFVVNVDGSDILERLEEDAYEECGEASEGWLSCPYKDIEKLSERLTECVNEWLKETNQEPSFYHIHSISIETIK